MITAKQARNGAYNKTIIWCEKRLQPEIEFARLRKTNQASKLFTADEVNPEELKTILEKHGYIVRLTNMTERAGFKSSYGVIYNVTVNW